MKYHITNIWHISQFIFIQRSFENCHCTSCFHGTWRFCMVDMAVVVILPFIIVWIVLLFWSCLVFWPCRDRKIAVTIPFLENGPFFAMYHLMICLHQLQDPVLLSLNYVSHLQVESNMLLDATSRVTVKLME